MDGLSQNKTAAHEKKIESWMRTIIVDGGIDRYDDLHIDRIDAKWKARDLWIPGALQAYELALNIRDRNGFPFSVVLGFSLQSGEQRKGINFCTRVELESEFNRTPPSLYLFRPEEEPWAQSSPSRSTVGTDMFVERISVDIFEVSVVTIRCYYVEFRSTDANEYSRSVLIAG
jgi:hypothetical protein